MNYQKIYDDICKRGLERILPKEVYTEKHHIIPKCLGGDNSKENITILTAREHFLVHYILAAKIYKNHRGLWNAFRKMLYFKRNYQIRYVPSGRFYDQLKNELSNACKGEGNHFFGKTHSLETRKKISNALKGENHPLFGKTLSVEIKKRMSAGSLGKIFSEEHKRNIGRARRGRKHTEESKILIGSNSPLSKSCIIDGIIFRSISEASRQLKITKDAVTRRIKSKKIKWLNWKYY